MLLQYLLFSLGLFASLANGEEAVLVNLMGTEMQKCINCLCHSRSGCWSRINCAKYSISFDYWKTAGAMRLANESDDNEAYKNCIQDENCILNTIKRFTEQFGDIDCNTDGSYDCKDRLAVHLFGENCISPRFGDTYARRFNECADDVGVERMLPFESFDAPVVV